MKQPYVRLGPMQTPEDLRLALRELEQSLNKLIEAINELLPED